MMTHALTRQKKNIRETIREVFGPNSPEFHDHQYDDIWHGGYNGSDEDRERQQKFLAGVVQTVLMLEGLVTRLEEKRADIADAPTVVNTVLEPDALADTRRVFVVYGHDEEAKQTVARFLEKLRLEPIILSERPNEGRTIIEKFESNANVSFAVVLLTPDDMGYPCESPDAARPRARQNVILELGYFVGHLSRARVCALYKGSTELPSDIHGVVYITMDEADGWKLKLARELKQAGFNVDLNLAV
jgi:predicted nucleotide-binding protein